MGSLSKYNPLLTKVVKSVLIGIGVLIGLLFVTSLIKTPMGGRMPGFNFSVGGFPSRMPVYDMGNSYAVSEGSSPSYSGKGMMDTLSIRNISPIFPPNVDTSGSDAEAYEVTDYSAQIESSHIEETCGIIKGWKTLSYVIFENANESDKQCYFTFKVEHARVAEVLAAVKALDPKDLSQNTSTIKQQIADFTSRTEILEKKRSSIDKTLESALRAYDEITVLATRTQNADALAKIIDSKIGIIERLTQERININAQLDELARGKERELDRLKYTYFNINVYENKFFDGETILDSWKATLKAFVQTVNIVVQSITLGLLGFILWLLPILLYALILLLVAKYTWRFAKSAWKA